MLGLLVGFFVGGVLGWKFGPSVAAWAVANWPKKS